MGVIKFPGPEERKAEGYGKASANSDRCSKITEYRSPLEHERGAERLQFSPGTPEGPSVPGRKKRNVCRQSMSLPSLSICQTARTTAHEKPYLQRRLSRVQLVGIPARMVSYERC
jgi:hypothetical protein